MRFGGQIRVRKMVTFHLFLKQLAAKFTGGGRERESETERGKRVRVEEVANAQNLCLIVAFVFKGQLISQYQRGTARDGLG
eukprot:2785029-Pleurochrysis_carterae.AAC.4